MTSKKIVIVKARRGNVIGKQVVDGELCSVLKNIVVDVLKEWNPLESNLDVIRYDYRVEKKLPLKPEELDLILQFNPRRQGDRVVFTIPLYIVSYKNYKLQDQIVDEEVVVVAPYITSEYIGIVEEAAIMATEPS